jgi:hypothetical protein
MEVKSTTLDFLKKITGENIKTQNNNFKRDSSMYKQDLTPDEQKKLNALLNLDFEDYKKEIKLYNIERDEIDYSKLEFVDDSNKCKSTENNSFLIIGIFLIIFAVILMLLTKSS